MKKNIINLSCNFNGCDNDTHGSSACECGVLS